MTASSIDEASHSPRSTADGKPSHETRSEPHLEERRVLALSGLRYKNEQHYGPLADVTEELTLVCLDSKYALENANSVVVPQVGPRPLRLVFLFFLALYEGYKNEYDAVVSISLVPYGLYALALKAVFRTPAHLGIIGGDLNYHLDTWYGSIPKLAFRQFDVVSVPGTSQVEQLRELGIPRNRIEILTNAIDTETYQPPADDVEPEFDFVWVGRFSEEKAPLRFVTVLEKFAQDDSEFRAVMVGDGPLREDVREALHENGLTDNVELPGWVDDPVTYYHRSKIFVLTSNRDALPLVMIEAMATRLACIVPPVGSIPDVVRDGQNGVVVSNEDLDTYVTAMKRLEDDSAYRRSLAANAAAVRSDFSLESSGDDWRRIVRALGS